MRSLPACTPRAPSWSARWRSTRTGIGSVTSAALKASSSRWPNSSAERRLVLALDHEERSADGAGKLRLLGRELEARRQLRRHFHSVGELESDGPLLLVIDRVHHVDREAALVEHVRHADVLDLKRGRLEGAGLDDQVALLLQDAVDPTDRLAGLARRLDREDVA